MVTVMDARIPNSFAAKNVSTTSRLPMLPATYVIILQPLKLSLFINRSDTEHKFANIKFTNPWIALNKLKFNRVLDFDVVYE